MHLETVTYTCENVVYIVIYCVYIVTVVKKGACTCKNVPLHLFLFVCKYHMLAMPKLPQMLISVNFLLVPRNLARAWVEF